MDSTELLELNFEEIKDRSDHLNFYCFGVSPKLIPIKVTDHWDKLTQHSKMIYLLVWNSELAPFAWRLGAAGLYRIQFFFSLQSIYSLLTTKHRIRAVSNYGLSKTVVVYFSGQCDWKTSTFASALACLILFVIQKLSEINLKFY